MADATSCLLYPDRLMTQTNEPSRQGGGVRRWKKTCFRPPAMAGGNCMSKGAN